MKSGGNASATEYFTKQGGSSFLDSVDGKKKYTSTVADMYKAEIQRRVKEDAARFPTRIWVEGLTEALAAQDGPASAAADEDDFFDSWDKPAKKPSTPTPKPAAAPAAPKAAAPPVVGTPRATPAPKFVAASPQTSRPSSAASTTTTTGTRAAAAGKTKLGAKRAGAPINFADAQRKAQEEEERAKNQRAEEETRQREEAAAAEAAAAAAAAAPADSPVKDKAPALAAPKPKHARGTSQEMERLGMGMRKIGFGTPAAPAPTARSGSAAADDTDYARKKFGTQKAISSDMYFERGDFSANAQTEAKERLQNFSGATSISSNQYFGRDEPDEDDLQGGGAGGNADWEGAARDAVQRLMANPEVQNAADSIRAGAMKLSEYLATMGEGQR